MPPILTPEQREISTSILQDFETYLRPATNQWLTARARSLLLHYHLPNATPADLAVMLADWIVALNNLPAWAVTVACQQYLCTQSFRPAPHDVRALAMEAVGDAAQTRDRLKAALVVPPPEHVVVEILWPLVRRREIWCADVDILIRPLSVTVYTEHMTGRMRAGHPGLRNPGERGKTESLLRRAADHLQLESCYLIGPDDTEPVPPTLEEREHRRQEVEKLMSRWRTHKSVRRGEDERYDIGPSDGNCCDRNGSIPKSGG